MESYITQQSESTYNTLVRTSVVSSDLEFSIFQKIEEKIKNEPDLKKRETFQKSLESMKKCGLQTGEMLRRCDCGISISPIMHHCSLRTCFNCSKIRQRKILKKFLPFMDSLPVTYNLRFRFLTISPKNYETLEEGLKSINKSWNRFLETDYALANILSVGGGGIYIIETTKHDNGYHMHMHIILYSRYLENRVEDKQDSPLVKALTHAFRRSVNVFIQSKEFKSKREILKYSLKYVSAYKDSFDNIDDFVDYILKTRKKRLLNTFGCFYNYKPTKKACVCWFCKKEIEFIMDYEVINAYLKSQEAVRMNKNREKYILKPPPLNFTTEI